MTLRIDIPRQPRRVRINLTPIMDVVFILVVFFLLAAQFTEESGQTLSLAGNATAQSETAAPARLVVEQAGYRLDAETLSADQLAEALGALGNKPLLIEAADDAAYQALVTALDAAGQAGLEQIRIAPSNGSGDGQ